MPCRYQGHSSAKNIDANHQREREREGLGGKLRNDWMDSRRQQQQKALIPPYWDSEHN